MLYMAVPPHAYAPNRRSAESPTGRNGDALIAAEEDGLVVASVSVADHR